MFFHLEVLIAWPPLWMLKVSFSFLGFKALAFFGFRMISFEGVECNGSSGVSFQVSWLCLYPNIIYSPEGLPA